MEEENQIRVEVFRKASKQTLVKIAEKEAEITTRRRT